MKNRLEGSKRWRHDMLAGFLLAGALLDLAVLPTGFLVRDFFLGAALDIK
jgi:hypothetical protein